MVLYIFSATLFAAEVRSHQIKSAAMEREIGLSVILPGSCAAGERRFPVVYLLHGYDGDHRNWIDKTDVETLADLHEIIIACPDGDKDSWYFDSPVDQDSRYETHVAKEAVQAVDSLYRTLSDPKYRAITGLSMGGHGALFLAARHSDVFGAAGSMSGGVNLLPYKDSRWSLDEKLGLFSEHPERWEEWSAISASTAFQGKDVALIIDCGVEDFFLEVNRQLHFRLTSLGIKHDYIEREGKHDWDYWSNAVRYQMFFFFTHFSDNGSW
ncbi:MAG: alpha/beta hydrolase [Calditrichia bacterium]